MTTSEAAPQPISTGSTGSTFDAAVGAWHEDELELLRAAVALGAGEVGGVLSVEERWLRRLAREAWSAPSRTVLTRLRREIVVGGDPLGEWFCELRSARQRRDVGAVYTPTDLVAPMVEWVLAQQPGRLVDAGCGSGRFAAAIARKAPEAALIAVDSDAVATTLCRAAIAAVGHARARVVHGDYTQYRLPPRRVRTAFVGNPPYVRHHQLAPQLKEWARRTAQRLGYPMSGLAGLHAYFFLATAVAARPGDVGCFVTSAEWLDVNYGSIVRSLLLDGLGADSLHVLRPESMPFGGGVATTAVVTTFRPGERSEAIRFRQVGGAADLGDLAEEGEPVSRQRVRDSARWSTLVRTRNPVPEGFVELGELCRVHRGAVTGSNATWVVRGVTDLPGSVLFPSVTKARELFGAGAVLDDHSGLRKVIDLPADLDVLDDDDRTVVDRFLRRAKKAAVHEGYVASHRRAWWAVGLREPAPILATYMARRPPTFVRNAAEARHINIAHGLYPRQRIPEKALRRLAASLRKSVTLGEGRVYAGGLTKFEPKEMERLLVPDLDNLLSDGHLASPLDAGGTRH